MIPKKIQPYFKTTRQTRDGDNSIIEGILTCCNGHDFEVFVVGEIKHSMFSKMRMFPENDKTVIDIIWKIRYTKRNGKGCNGCRFSYWKMMQPSPWG